MKNEELKKRITLAKQASLSLVNLSAHQRKKILLALSCMVTKKEKAILKANKNDIKRARENHSDSFIERLTLNQDKIGSMAASLDVVARAEDILFRTTREMKGPSGIYIRKVTYPLGLIGMIYESRPNVTIDAFALAFKSGNAIILKGGKEIKNTNRVLVGITREILRKFKINENAIQDVSEIDRNQTSIILKDKRIDCLIPRGGKKLIDYVTKNAQIPVIITGASVVHTYVDHSADLKMAERIITNAKTRRVSICNTLDVLLIHRKVYQKLLAGLSSTLAMRNIEIRADQRSYQLLEILGYSKLKKAKEDDFDTEFLDHILAIKIVDDFDKAMKHIKTHSLGHSEAIITNSKSNAKRFFREIDAACLYLNTSTQFSDGQEFGMLGEMGISTQKLHARGPFSYHELVTYKYLVDSNGLTRS